MLSAASIGMFSVNKLIDNFPDNINKLARVCCFVAILFIKQGFSLEYLAYQCLGFLSLLIPYSIICGKTI